LPVKNLYSGCTDSGQPPNNKKAVLCGRLRTAFSIKQEALFVVVAGALPIDDVAQGIFSSQLGQHDPGLLLVLPGIVLVIGFAGLVAPGRRGSGRGPSLE
jgi:hypothetical protein